MSSAPIALHANLLHCLDNPLSQGDEALEYIEGGVLLLEEGYVRAYGHTKQVDIPKHSQHIDLQQRLIIPGFIDTHVHYPQVDIIASYGKQLLDWLERYTFPEESRFADPSHAEQTAQFFLDELLTNGTTTALVFGTVHKTSVNAFFQEAKLRNLRMICGKVMMDRNAPPELLDTAQSSLTDSQELINRWHGCDRLGYAVTPRFAPTSTPEQLAAAQQLLTTNPGVHLHTHMAENAEECRWVAELFPGTQDYLGVYEKFGLVQQRSVFAHGIHLSDDAWKRLSQADAAVSHCPGSNLFLGSGLFNLSNAQKYNTKVGLGTDVGGGDSLSILKTLNQAYKVQQLQQSSLSPSQAFYMATLGGARALDLEPCIGNFQPGKEADFLVINENATPIMTRRIQAQQDWQDRLFTLMMLGDDRCIEQTWVMGQRHNPHRQT